jgi:hypothetical protein
MTAILKESGKPFAVELRAAMEARGVSVVELSRQTGIHDTTLSSYRHGERIPNVARADLLADVLDSPGLRRAVLRMYTRRCVRCRRRVHVDPRNVNHQRYCGSSCRTMAQRERNKTVPKAREKLGRRVGLLEKAIAAMCGSCEPVDRLCRDGSCPLRAFSPFPLVQRKVA